MLRDARQGVVNDNARMKIKVKKPLPRKQRASPSRSCGWARASASSSVAGFKAGGALDGNRFSVEAAAAWKGQAGASNWWWQVEFEKPRQIGAILQVAGDHPFVFRNAPRRSLWERSDDGVNWSALPETALINERRLFRIHRLSNGVKARFLRLNIMSVSGEFPTLREVEVYSEPQARIAFPDWIVVVNTTHDAALPGHGQEFIPLAKSCAKAFVLMKLS